MWDSRKPPIQFQLHFGCQLCLKFWPDARKVYETSKQQFIDSKLPWQDMNSLAHPALHRKAKQLQQPSRGPPKSLGCRSLSIRTRRQARGTVKWQKTSEGIWEAHSILPTLALVLNPHPSHVPSPGTLSMLCSSILCAGAGGLYV